MTNPPLNLCFISNPQSIHTRRWLEWFARRGHKITLIADAPVRGSWQGVQVFDLPQRFNVRVVRFAVWAFWAKQIVASLKPDVLHAHRVSSGGWLGAFCGYHPFMVAPWGSDLLTHPDRSTIARRLAAYVLRRADLVVVNSQALYQKSVQYGASPSSVKMLYWTNPEIDIFKPGLDTSALRQDLGLLPSASLSSASLASAALGSCPIVLSVRGVSPIYNIDSIVRAVPTVKQRFPDMTLFLLNFNAQPAYREAVDRLIRATGFEESIRWVGPVSSREDLARLFNLADVILSVPSSDSTPSTVLEAMACETPVVASDLPSLREWITDQENGRLVPVRDSSALAAAVNDLLADPVMRGKLGQRARQTILERGSYQSEMEKMEQLYYSLLGG